MSDAPVLADPAPASEQEAFLAAWQEFMASVRRARSRAADREGAELTAAQFHLLAALEDAPARSVGELAQAAGVSSPTATRMLDALERDGIVRREPATDDRRRIHVRPTAKGSRALDALRARIDAKCHRLYERLPASERDQAARLLRLLTEAVEGL